MKYLSGRNVYLNFTRLAANSIELRKNRPLMRFPTHDMIAPRPQVQILPENEQQPPPPASNCYLNMADTLPPHAAVIDEAHHDPLTRALLSNGFCQWAQQGVAVQCI